MGQSVMDRLEARRWFAIWKHYEASADARKEELFKTGTWQLGLTAAIFAYAVKEGVGPTPEAGASNASITIAGGILGLALAYLTRITVREVNSHIVSSWRNANRAHLKIPELEEVLGTPTDPPARTGPAKRLLWVVRGSVVASVLLILYGALSLIVRWLG